MTQIRLIWHRRDLRLHDNALYHPDNNDDDDDETTLSFLISLFVFDPALIEPRPSTVHNKEWKTVWTGPHALSALLHAVHGLRQSLRARSSDLWIRCGDPVEWIPALSRQVKATQVAWHVEPGWYEEQTSRRLQDALEREGIECIRYIGCTLYHPDDLPQTAQEWKRSQSTKYQTLKQDRIQDARQPRDCKSNVLSSSFADAPRIMGNFRTACRHFASVRPCWKTPTTCIRSPPPTVAVEPGEIPTLAQLLQPMLQLEDGAILGLSQQQMQHICNAALTQHETDQSCQRGSEPWALERLDYFLMHHAASADRSRADVEVNHSSKLSLSLALGTISPRLIYEKAVLHNCSWLMNHLEMRDFFLFTVLNAGSRVYQPKGLPVRTHSGKWHAPRNRLEYWQRWSTGTTGFPLVDAGMRQLQATGYCSNRVRQNCASFLAKDLEIDWRAGADLFQFLLEDHCVGSNWSNWMYFSGVGSDPKSRHFRTISQALRYDPAGTYVSQWVDQLKNNVVVDMEAKFRPWDYIADWGIPVVDPATQLTWNDQQRFIEKGYLC